MSFWIPRKGADGRWKLYSVSFPILPIMVLIAILLGFIIPLLIRFLNRP